MTHFLWSAVTLFAHVHQLVPAEGGAVCLVRPRCVQQTATSWIQNHLFKVIGATTAEVTRTTEREKEREISGGQLMNTVYLYNTFKLTFSHCELFRLTASLTPIFWEFINPKSLYGHLLFRNSYKDEDCNFLAQVESEDLSHIFCIHYWEKNSRMDLWNH